MNHKTFIPDFSISGSNPFFSGKPHFSRPNIENSQDRLTRIYVIKNNRNQIGNHVHINLDCTVGHDVVIEDFVTLAPGVHISGNVVLNRGCYIGTGSNLIEKTTVGSWSLVGAGSTVIKDVPNNTKVVGVPAKTIKTREDGWHLK